MPTRNTKLYKSTVFNQNGDKVDVIYRDLNVEETTYIINLKNESKKREEAYKLAVDGEYHLSWPTILQIGETIILKSKNITEDDELFNLTVQDYRESVNNDSTFNLISQISRVFSGTSITDLLKLTYRDLIELVCLCEVMTNKKLFNVDGRIGKQNNPKNKQTEFPDDGKTLQEKMKELKKF